MSFIQDAIREWAFNVGHDNPDVPWLLSDYDTWERNPFYRGPSVPHPDDHEYEDEELTVDEINAQLDEAYQQDNS